MDIEAEKAEEELHSVKMTDGMKKSMVRLTLVFEGFSSCHNYGDSVTMEWEREGLPQ